MPRRRQIEKREILPDPRFNDTLVSQFINCLMVKGKKSVAERIFNDTMDLIADRTREDPLKIFRRAMENAKPALEVKSRRVGGATYQVPIEVRSERRTALAIRWILKYARSRSEKGIVQKLAAEFIDAFNGRGNAVKKKDDTHRMAEANKAFAHYRW
ncbi:MAG: 30S ribosomal protein S7 [Deltaproteobacteria bacterium]|nr:30S ribosomal protein S7 [Deltaproteobacteria bacterium]